MMTTATRFSDTLSELTVENVYVYAGDAVRWDYLPDRVRDFGTTVKTVGASTTSAPSFTSMLSGLYPTSHQVYSFNYKLGDEVATVLDLDDVSTGFLNSIFEYAAKEHRGLDPIYRMLDIDDPPTAPVVDESPFVFFERGPGGHAPYGDFAGGATEYFERHRNHGERELKADYERSIELDVDLFEDRLDMLDAKDVLEDTLVVYTSDHGEFLGENGMVGHNSPMAPETAYVPTVFVHPDLPDGAVTDAVMSHVDLFPTILDVLGWDHDSPFDGESLVRTPPGGPKCCIYNNRFVSDKLPLTDGHLRYEGVWDADGGYVFPRSNLAKRLLVLGGKTYKSPKRHFLRRNVGSLLGQYSKGTRKYADPAFSINDAKTALRRLNEHSPIGLRQELEPVNTEQLEDLGYL